jgi:FkbM family methyltransferase
MRGGKTVARSQALIVSAICLLGPGGSAALAGEIVGREESRYSFANEEVITRDFFHDKREGVFLDVGAFHYRMVSSTYYLEKHLDWSGIAVDALAEFALGYIENRPRTRFFNFLVTDHSGTVESFYRVPGAHTGLSTKNPNWLQSWLKSFGKRHPDAVDAIEQKQEIWVMTITLNDLLEKNGVSKIDFLSMNIEGAEMKALAGFDIERFSPELALIECLGNEKRLMRYFTSRGYVIADEYEPYAHKKNCYFKKKP